MGFGCAASEMPDRVILIVVDTLRRDHLSVYGADIETPNVERLARRGVVYEHAAASFHQTSMSMGALFTGRTPSLESGDAGRTVKWISANWCGLARFLQPGEADCVPRGLRTLGEVMRDRGYWALAVVSNPFLYRPAGFHRGFDTWIELEGTHAAPLMGGGDEAHWARLRDGEHTTDAALAALSERPDDRLFLYVHYMDVHDYAMANRSYREAVEQMDRNLGRLLDFLEEEGLLEDAVIVLTSDHGERLGERHFTEGLPAHMGNPSFEPLLRIPLVWVGSGPAPDTLVRSEDVYRMLARTAGAEVQTPRQLRPEELFVSEIHYQTFRQGRWKSYWKREDDRAHLVDLAADPGEQRDVAEERPDILAAHRRRIEALGEALAAPDAPSRELDPHYQQLLRSLGYLQ
jgi:arylsulfatase A-like enzyme